MWISLNNIIKLLGDKFFNVIDWLVDALEYTNIKEPKPYQDYKEYGIKDYAIYKDKKRKE